MMDMPMPGADTAAIREFQYKHAPLHHGVVAWHGIMMFVACALLIPKGVWNHEGRVHGECAQPE